MTTRDHQYRVEDVYGDFLDLERCEMCYAWVDPMFMSKHMETHR